MSYTYIYALIDPRNNEIRYVGKANNPKARLNAHKRLAIRGSHLYRSKWIGKLLSLGLSPILLLLQKIEENLWQECERYWIKLFRDIGCKLTNIAPGGEGVACASMQEGRKRGSMSEEQKRKISDALKGRPIAPEALQKRIRDKCPKGHDYDYVSPGRGTRMCRICNNERHRARRKRLKEQRVC